MTVRVSLLDAPFACTNDRPEIDELADHSGLCGTWETQPDNTADVALGIATRNSEYAP